MKKKTEAIIYVTFTILTFIFCLLNLLTKMYFPTVSAILLLILNFFNIIKYKKNKRIFFISIIILYFNYSIIICRYLFGGTKLLKNLYAQLYDYGNIMGLSINLLLLFNIIFYLPISLYLYNKESNKNELDANKNKDKYNLKIINVQNKRILIFFLRLFIIIVLVYHLVKRITYNTTLFEYLFIVFIFGFLLSKGNKKDKITFEILLILCSIYSLYVGERIGVLQFIIADVVINYLDRFNIKMIVTSLMLGIIFFTFMGVYGDILDSSIRSFNELSIETVANEFSARRLALDTCVSAYFSSASMIEASQQNSIEERLENFFEYHTEYLLLGAKSNYKNLNLVAREYHVDYGGGYIIGYYYYWLGTIGVTIIAFYAGYIMRKIIQIEENSSNFIKSYSVFFIASLPRWYLYVPSLLFRGTLIFIIVYILINLFINSGKSNSLL